MNEENLNQVANTGSSMMERFFEAAAASVVYSLLGVILFAISFLVMVKLSPFSIRREIEEDQNVALGVIMGSVIIGIAIVVASAIQG